MSTEPTIHPDDIEPSFYTVGLEPANVGDLMLSVAATLDTNLTPGLAPLDVENLIGIVSESEGGIIAYALGDTYADQLVRALTVAEGKS